MTSEDLDLSEKAEAKESDSDTPVVSDNQASGGSSAGDASASKVPEDASEVKSEAAEPVSGEKPAASVSEGSEVGAAENADNQVTAEREAVAQDSGAASTDAVDGAAAPVERASPAASGQDATDSSSSKSASEVSAKVEASLAAAENLTSESTEAALQSQAESANTGSSPADDAADTVSPSTDAATPSSSTSTAGDSPAAVQVDLPAFPQVAHHIPAEAVPTEAAFKAENFGRDEVRQLLVPVKPFNRLVACALVIFCSSWLLYMFLTPGPRIRAQGMHVVALPEPGTYVLSFHGEITDPYGWTKDGRFRRAMIIDVEPLDKGQIVEKITPIKDMSGGTYFTVGEYQFNLPGKYQVTVQWDPVEDRAKGQIFFEKDPVERFFLKWILGIVGTISFFYMIGVPLSTRMAISTLETPKKA